MRTVLLAIPLTMFMISPVAAQVDRPVRTECMQQLVEFDQDLSARQNVPSAVARTLREMRQQAQSLDQAGHSDACLAVVAAMEDVADEGAETAQQHAQTLDDKVAPVEMSSIGGDFFADELTNMDIRNLRNEHIGTVQKLVLNPKGQVTHAVVSHGGFLGLGTDRVLVPFERFKINQDHEFLIYDVPEDAFGKLPKINDEQYDLKTVDHK